MGSVVCNGCGWLTRIRSLPGRRNAGAKGAKVERKRVDLKFTAILIVAVAGVFAGWQAALFWPPADFAAAGYVIAAVLLGVAVLSAAG